LVPDKVEAESLHPTPPEVKPFLPDCDTETESALIHGLPAGSIQVAFSG